MSQAPPTILYGSKIEPPQNWVKKMVLHGFKVSTFVPHLYGKNEALGEYESLGVWSGTNINGILLSDSFIDECVEKLQAIPHSRYGGMSSEERLFVDKLPWNLTLPLKEEGLLQEVSEREFRVERRHGATVLLDNLAAKIAYERNWSCAAPSDSFLATTVEPMGKGTPRRALALAFEGLPSPRPGVELRELVQFADEHGKVLRDYHQYLDALIKGSSPSEAAEIVRSSIESYAREAKAAGVAGPRERIRVICGDLVMPSTALSIYDVISNPSDPLMDTIRLVTGPSLDLAFKHVLIHKSAKGMFHLQESYKRKLYEV